MIISMKNKKTGIVESMTLTTFCEEFNNTNELESTIIEVRASNLTDRIVDYINQNMTTEIYAYDKNELREIVVSELK